MNQFVTLFITLAIVYTFYRVVSTLDTEKKEHFWGRRGRRGRRRRLNPYRYLHNFRRRRPRYPYWNNVTIWPSTWYYAPAPCNCKRGCTPDGCAYPGTGPYDCVWASDCNCC